DRRDRLAAVLLGHGALHDLPIDAPRRALIRLIRHLLEAAIDNGFDGIDAPLGPALEAVTPLAGRRTATRPAPVVAAALAVAVVPPLLTVVAVPLPLIAAAVPRRAGFTFARAVAFAARAPRTALTRRAVVRRARSLA
ncbi:MAG TPA: hypothetical protein VN668_04290, partial [Stellaceae bacterium]|nr:hypothetical protein [Stellaceae bacterium]